MKPGDLVVWTEYAAVYSPAPAAGEYAGTVVRVIPPTRLIGSRAADRWRAKVEILAEETFIVRRRFIEVISES